MARGERKQQAATAAALMPRRAILVVETDPDIRALYRQMFPAEEYDIEECDDGAEALGKAICRCPDVIVTEMRVRRIDGLALCRLLRSDAATKNIPIMVVTTSTSGADRVRAANAGADMVIEKPFSFEAITAAVLQLIDGPRAAATASSAADVEDGEPQKRRCMSRSFERQWTTTPPLQPPPLHCPSCDARLAYQHSFIGGVTVRAREQWDYFDCGRCGPFQYRHRTRSLKPAL